MQACYVLKNVSFSSVAGGAIVGIIISWRAHPHINKYLERFGHELMINFLKIVEFRGLLNFSNI